MSQPRKKIYIISAIVLAILTITFASIFYFTANKPTNSLKFSKATLTYINKKIPEITLTPADNEEIGTLTFPKLDVSVPIVYGYNAEYMEQYFDVVGLEAWNNFPGQKNKLYINGHRHLAFQNLKHMEVNDTVKITMPYGEFTYKVSKEPQIVLASDKEAIDFYLNDHDTEFSPQILRLQTCYPFEAGSTLDHRYLVDFVLIESIYN